MELDQAIKKRHSVRRFKSRKPDWRKILEAIESANDIPLAGNISSLNFLVVNDPKKIEKLRKASQQDFVGQAKYVIVVCSDNTQIVRAFDKRGERYSRQQAGAAIENFLLKITDLGLASCWVGAFSDKEVKNILEIPGHVNVEALLPVGYELSFAFRKRKKPNLDKHLFFNVYKGRYGNPQKYMKPEHQPEAY